MSRFDVELLLTTNEINVEGSEEDGKFAETKYLCVYMCPQILHMWEKVCETYTLWKHILVNLASYCHFCSFSMESILSGTQIGASLPVSLLILTWTQSDRGTKDHNCYHFKAKKKHLFEHIMITPHHVGAEVCELRENRCCLKWASDLPAILFL